MYFFNALVQQKIYVDVSNYNFTLCNERQLYVYVLVSIISAINFIDYLVIGNGV